MDIKDLNKQQLILLSLLISFVTSIATGIVTVTLMDQAPPGVTQTINRVIEKTVQVVSPETGKTKEVVTETIIIKEEDLVVGAVEKNIGNVVRVGTLSRDEGFRIGSLEISENTGKDTFKPTGESGFVVSKDGFFAVDVEMVKGDRRYGVETQDGVVREAKVLARGERLALLQIELSSAGTSTTATSTATAKKEGLKFSDVVFGDSQKIRIGQTAVALGFNTSVSLLLGVVSRIEKIDIPPKTEGQLPVKETKTLYTSMDFSLPYSGGPLLNAYGELLGINMVTAEGAELTIPVRELEVLISTYRSKGVSLEEITPPEDAPGGAEGQTASVGDAP